MPTGFGRGGYDMRSQKVDDEFDRMDREISKYIKTGRRVAVGMVFGVLTFLSAVTWGIIKLIQHFTG